MKPIHSIGAAILALCLLTGCQAGGGASEASQPTTTTTTATTTTAAPTTTTTTTAAPTTTTAQAVPADGPAVAQPTYIRGVLIANKTYALPANYAPGVNPEAQRAVNEMIAAARQEGLKLWVASGFRDYALQKRLYERYSARDGKAAADRYSARPGHSEHQTGLAFDFNSVDMTFDNTPESRWLAENCWRYGFIIRYPADKEAITGYKYEPWHVRYLGKELAKDVYDSGLCLEEYLGITSEYADG